MAVHMSSLESEVKKLRVELEEEQDKKMQDGQVIEGPGGLKLTRLEVARVLRERNEYKEKYLSLLEQIRYAYTYRREVCMYVCMHVYCITV